MAERDEGALVHLLRSVVVQLKGGKLTTEGRTDLVLRTLNMVRLFVGRNLPYQNLEHCLYLALEKVSWFRIPDMPGQDPYDHALHMDLNEVLGEIRGLRVFGPLYGDLHASNQGRPLIFLGQHGPVLVYRGTDSRRGGEAMRIAQPTVWSTPHVQQLLAELFEADHEAPKRILGALHDRFLRWVIEQEDRLASARRMLHEVGVMGILLEELSAQR